MNALRTGSLCSGVGGLDLAVTEVLGGSLRSGPALRLLGNAVVPLQASHALRLLLPRVEGR